MKAPSPPYSRVERHNLKPLDLVLVASSASSLVVLMLSLVLWGLKLESRLDELSRGAKSQEIALNTLRFKIDAGVLPRAEERLNHNEKNIDMILDHISGHEHD